MKKILALAAGVLLSLNATAGYVQYELSGLPNPYFLSNASTVVIRDEDKSVAYFSIFTDRDYIIPMDRGDGYHNNWLLETTTSFTGLGPTNMYMRDVMQEEYTKQVWLLFSNGSAAGTYNFTMRILTKPGPQAPYPELSLHADVTYSGTAKEVPVFEWMAEADARGDFEIARDIPYYDPTQVPEPGSLALLAIGALGAAGAARRRKAETPK
jgi:hypothetical protein